MPCSIFKGAGKTEVNDLQRANVCDVPCPLLDAFPFEMCQCARANLGSVWHRGGVICDRRTPCGSFMRHKLLGQLKAATVEALRFLEKEAGGGDSGRVVVIISEEIRGRQIGDGDEDVETPCL